MNLCHHYYMRYHDIKHLDAARFKRLVGIQPATFEQMLDTLRTCELGFGRPPKLILEDRLMLALSYWREYRTLLHTGMSYGISEASAHRIVRHVENVLINSNKFHLPKKLPSGAGIDWDVVVVDATEMVIERPKKTEKLL